MAFSLPPGMDISMIPAAVPPPGVISNFINPVSLTQTIIGISTITSVLAFLVLSARLYGTVRITRSVGSDDYACIVAFLFSIAYSSLVIHTRHYARHSWDLALSDFTGDYFKIILAETFVGALGLLLSKLSILLLLLRLFSPNRWTRRLLIIGICWATLVTATGIIVTGALCAPRPGESFASPSLPTRCLRQQTWVVIQGVSNVLLDFYILYLPIPLIWNLNLNFKRKLGVTGIFMTGLIACAASVSGLVYKCKLLRTSDTLWNSYIVDILNIVEINVAISVACMPACASCLRYMVSNLRSFIDTRFSDTKNSKENSESVEKNPRDEIKNSHKNKYWRFREWRGTRDGPPQITAVTRKSRPGLSFGTHAGFDRKETETVNSEPRDSSLSSSEGDQKSVQRIEIV